MTKTAILVVEDERIIAKGIEKQLTAMGYTVAGSAKSGEDGVRQAIELHPDLILMDISLGAGIDGIEAAGRIRQQLDIPIVYLTANSDVAILHRVKGTDPFGYVLKPYDERDLQTAIEIGLYRHRMERRLRDNEQWLAATLASIGDGVIATDERGRVRYLNAEAETLTGWRQDEAVGRDIEEVFRIVNEASRERVESPAMAALQRGEPTALAPNTLLIDRAGMERAIDDSAAPIRDVAGNVSGTVLVFRDISERRRLEALKEQFLSHVSHELLTPLSAITQFASILGDGLAGPLTVEQAQFQQIILKNARQLKAMVDDLLDVSRIQTGKLTVIPGRASVTEAVCDALDAISGKAQAKGVSVTSEVPADLPAAFADETRLRQILMILLDNAVKFTGTLGAVAVHARLAAEPGFLRVDVSDSGCGIPHDVCDRVFDRLFQAERGARSNRKGLGLGLYICRELVTSHGGTITVQSTPGTGTIFSFTLPVFRPAP
ncbi:MAG: ATP-binding protein [Vicinamibacterales bacterium]